MDLQEKRFKLLARAPGHITTLYAFFLRVQLCDVALKYVYFFNPSMGQLTSDS